LTIGFEAFQRSLQEAQPPQTLNAPLRALWFDARGEPASAARAASADTSHTTLRVRAYLARKFADQHEITRCYYYAGVKPWTGSLESEWEDIVRAVLVEQIVEQAYT
jgi:hypothetical protein